ncbi:D-serine deaminase-like pyridoxal phosphate-dependent protein [Kineococcus radiotolerans]|uniref:D-serine deaminase-like pyridoxal phosphate-dependent protein n=1 Tax=Kineococcus radiotolerans TaxID=131568 RepID=A0A7W4XWL7_KINRA|nr:alanine racemase [Kineococcus radiotolerans]MBB2900285.1 D-serine deaminase-like pyridoxal phosphate-dependent protein [Kineococcus radiotolerans]
MPYDAEHLGALDPGAKAVPVEAWGRDAAGFAAENPGLDRLPTPLVTLDAGALDANIAAMRDWTRSVGVDLAPHGKTTMAPSIWRAQLAAGALGITVATGWQLTVALRAEVPWILAAYPVLDPGVLRLLARPRRARVLVWADGVDVVAAMAPHVAGAAQPVDVLVELGGIGGRTGARSTAAAVEVARAVRATPGLRLAGVAGYEGAFAHDASPASLAVVRTYLSDLRGLHRRLLAEDLYPSVPEGLVVSAGGSAYFDVVADVLAPLHDPDGAVPTRVVVRSGAYVAHDDGFYRGVTPMDRIGEGGFRSALHGWVRVVSRPEPGLALADAGKRDLSFDEGLPEVQAVRRGGTGPTEPLEGAEVTALNDQHAFVRLTGPARELRVGDVLRLGLSHPCTVFDKWGLLPVVDDAAAPQPVLVDWVRTVFG